MARCAYASRSAYAAGDSQVSGATLNSGHLDDLTATRLCAEAMGIHTADVAAHGSGCAVWAYNRWPDPHDSEGIYKWVPLHDDAQAMALVKRFQLSVGFNGGWGCVKNDERGMLKSGAYHYEELNRAIVTCVANMAPVREGTNPHSINEGK